MRVTNQMTMNSMKLYLSQNMASLAKSQEMLASGHRINKASDDPIGTINTMRFSTNIVETKEYIEKIDQSTNFMNTTDATLNNANSVLQRVRELTVYAANGTHNETSLNAIADEVKQLREQLSIIANTTYGSKNIFSGTNVTTAPYDADNDIWLGNTDALNLEIGTGVKIQINSTMQGFFYNTGNTIGGQAVDLTRLTDTSQLTDKTFDLVFDDLQKKSRFVTITQQDIDDSGWGHPSAGDFVKVVRSSLPTTQVFNYDAASDSFSINGTQVYMKTSGGLTIDKANTIDTLGVHTTNNLAQMQSHSDLAGTLSFYTDAACTAPYIPAPSTVINDAANISQATGWCSSITRNQFNTIVTGMAANGGYKLAYDSTSGTYTLDGVAGKLQVGGIDVNDTFLKTVDDHSALLGQTITFVKETTGATTGLGTVTDANIATTDWGLNPTGDQYKDILQNAIDRSLGLLSTGKPKVLVDGNQDTGYTLKVMDTSLLPTDGSPTQVKIRTLGTESFGTIGNASAAMPLDETSLAQTVTSYFAGLDPAGKYSVAYDAGAHKFSISVDGGVTYNTGNIVLVDQNGNKNEITDVLSFLGIAPPSTPPTASAIIGMKLEFKEDALGGSTWPANDPTQPALTADGLRPTTMLTMNNKQFADNMTAFFSNLFSGHTLDVDDPVNPTQITGIDGITGTITIGGKAINDMTAYLAANGNDFSKLIGQEVKFTPDNTVINNNLITYVDASTGSQVKESSVAFTMGGQGLNGRGVRYQDNNIGIMQLVDRLIIDVQSGDHDNISANLSVIDDRMDTLNSERSVIGARINRLDLQRERMETSNENYTSLLSRYQDADMAEVIMNLNMQQNVYQASLAAGARIIMPTLADFLS